MCGTDRSSASRRQWEKGQLRCSLCTITSRVFSAIGVCSTGNMPSKSSSREGRKVAASEGLFPDDDERIDGRTTGKHNPAKGFSQGPTSAAEADLTLRKDQRCGHRLPRRG